MAVANDGAVDGLEEEGVAVGPFVHNAEFSPVAVTNTIECVAIPSPSSPKVPNPAQRVAPVAQDTKQAA
jgi:hypothetical protein